MPRERNSATNAENRDMSRTTAPRHRGFQTQMLKYGGVNVELLNCGDFIREGTLDEKPV